MRKIINRKKAFTLIEIAIVTIIISIFIAGVMGGRNLVNKARISSARSYTTQSPVASIGGLMLWYETTSRKSFGREGIDDGDAVSIWYDISPSVETVRNNATQSTSSYRPIYKTGRINNLPAVNFDGDDDFLEFVDGSVIVNSNYTIFVVGQRTDSGINHFIGGTEEVTDTSLHFGYRENTLLSIAQYNNNLEYTVPAYTTPSPIILSATFDFNDKKMYLNGSALSLTATGSSPDASKPLLSFSGASLGRHLTNFLKGDIAEVIIFKKYLKTEDRRAVEKYLGEKWRISVS